MSSAAVFSSYTPPPPEKPSEASRSALRAIDYPVAATPLPPSSSIATHSSFSTIQENSYSTHSSSHNNSNNAPQIRYCYFISAASVVPASTRSSPSTSTAEAISALASISTPMSNSNNNSNSPKPVYLTPHLQEPSDVYPNCTQPRSRPPKVTSTTTIATAKPTATTTATTTTTSSFVLGPNPPQIQLGFLLDEPLPPLTSLDTFAPSESGNDFMMTASSSTATISGKSSDTVLVERKDSGYGGSVSRSSSLATFSRGIRKVFWRNSQRTIGGGNSGDDSNEISLVSDRPLLDLDIDCGITQDVLNHEDWAQDLAQRLTLASASASDTPADSAVTAWLGQLSSASATPIISSREITSPESELSLTQLSEETLTFTLDHSKDSNSSNDIHGVVEEMVFVVPQSSLTLSKSESNLRMHQDNDTPATITTTTASNTPINVQQKSLRKVLSAEQLNKPQPPLPISDILNSKPVPSIPQETNSPTSASASPFNSFAKKLVNKAELKSSTKGKNNDRHRRHPNVQDIFTDSILITSEPRQSRESRFSTDTERTMDLSIEGDLAIKPASKRSNRLFKTLAALATSETKSNGNDSHNNNNIISDPVRPMSEILLSKSDLGPEISVEILTASSLRSSDVRRSSIPQWEGNNNNESRTDKDLETGPLVPPKPLFYKKGDIASASSLGDASSCGSLGNYSSSSVVDSSDEWEGMNRMMAQHAKEQDARYNADLKDLQALLYQVDFDGNSSPRQQQQNQQGQVFQHQFTPPHSANTSTGSLTLSSVSQSPSYNNNNGDGNGNKKRENKTVKGLSKKDDYMSHRMSSSKILPVVGKSKPRNKSRLSMTYGGGELEVVKHAKFDTPEAVARNKEIRKFISQEIYTTELNYLQYLHTIKEIFVDPLFNSLETDKPFIPRSNPLYQLLGHISSLITVSSQIAQRLGDCVRDEVWSDETSLVGTVFLDAKEPLSIFLKYGQSYGKGMKALRSLMKSTKKSTIGANSNNNNNSGSSSVHTPVGLSSITASSRIGKRQSLPSIFTFNNAVGAPLTAVAESSLSEHGQSKSESKPRSSHGLISSASSLNGLGGVEGEGCSEYEKFILNCIGGKETTSRFSLADLMILPIQRVTRYCLLLKDLKKHTDVEHPDYVCIVHALEQVHTLALATNNVQPSSMRA
ncbi:Rho guanine nucleotide exchange factor (GEF) 17 [Entomortierella lignicola]|nr:Rho guanine nucleotide exchange factor (GEF) 17 [Entomortierella lignicola]